jgi:hypothetical protein
MDFEIFKKKSITFIFNKFKPSTIAFFTSAGASAFWVPLILKMINNKGLQGDTWLTIFMYFIGIADGLYLITLLEDLKEQVNISVQQIMVKSMGSNCEISTRRKEALSGILDNNPRTHNRIFYCSLFFVIIILSGYITTINYSLTLK